MIKALSKQVFGAKYESIGKSLLATCILFFSIYTAGIKLTIAPFILYLTSTLFTLGVMCQILYGRHLVETMQGIFILPFENRKFTLSYVIVLGNYTLLTKTMLIWTLFFASASWNYYELVVAILCGCNACFVSAVIYLMLKKKNYVLPIMWASAIFLFIFFLRQSVVIFIMSVISLISASLYLFFYGDAYAFYNSITAKRIVLHTGKKKNFITYLVRYLVLNKNYLFNTVGLCIVACFLPLLFGEFSDLNILFLGFAILCLNTPICTLLSCDSDLEQAIRVLPQQGNYFFANYCLFICGVNFFIISIYLCCWQLISGGINVQDIWIAIMYALQSAILSVLMEWIYPIHNWKTESDLWHHPRKYIVPLFMMLLAIIITAWETIIWIWLLILLTEIFVLLSIVCRRS